MHRTFHREGRTFTSQYVVNATHAGSLGYPLPIPWDSPQPFTRALVHYALAPGSRVAMYTARDASSLHSNMRFPACTWLVPVNDWGCYDSKLRHFWGNPSLESDTVEHAALKLFFHPQLPVSKATRKSAALPVCPSYATFIVSTFHTCQLQPSTDHRPRYPD